MQKFFQVVFSLFAFLALSALTGCTPSFMEEPKTSEVGAFCNDPDDIPDLKEAALKGEDWYDRDDRDAWLACIDRIGGEEALPALTEVMLEAKDPHTRETALRQIIKYPEKGVIPIIQKALDDSDSDVANLAINELADRNAIQAMLRIVKDDSRYWLFAMSFLAGKLAHEGVTPALCEALARHPEEDGVARALAQHSDRDPCIVPTVLEVVRHYSEPKYLHGSEFWEEYLQPRIQADLDVITAQLDHPKAFPGLHELAKTAAPEIRWMVVRSVIHHKDHPKAMPFLCEVLLNDEQDVRELALGALDSNYTASCVAPALVNYLKAHLKDRFSGTAMAILAKSRYQAALPVLKEVVLKSSEDSYDAFMAMAAIDLTQMLAFAEEVLKDEKDVLRRQRAAIFLGLGNLPQAELLGKYLIEDGDSDVRFGAIRAFGIMAERHIPQIRTEAPGTVDPVMFPDLPQEEGEKVQAVAVKALLKMVEEKRDKDMRDLAIGTIGKFRDPSATPILERIGLDEKDPNRADAICGLMHLVKSVSPAIRKAANDPDHAPRLCATLALRYVPGREAAHLLVRLMTMDPDEEIGDWAKKGLEFGSEPEHFIPMLAKALPEADTQMRLDIVHTLFRVGRVGDKKHLPSILSVLEERLKVETTPSVREKIGEAVKFLREPEPDLSH